MIIVLSSKRNTKDKQSFMLPKSGSLEDTEWVEISIDFQKKEFFAKKKENFLYDKNEWICIENLTFSSSLFTRFLIDDPIIMDL